MKKIMLICASVPVIALAILIAIWVICGRHLNRECVYRTVEHDCGCGVLEARLRGTPVTRGKETVRGSPYGIFIAFKSPDVGGIVTLKRAELRDAANRDRVCAVMEEQTSSLEPDPYGVYTAYFYLKGLELEYVRYVLSIQIVVEKGGKTESRDIELTFEQNYREYWNNVFWSSAL